MRRAPIIILLYLATAAASWITNRELLLRVSYLLLALLIFGLIWTWTSVRNVRVVRKTRSRRAQVAQIAEERFTVYNSSVIPKLWLEIHDHSDLPGHRASRVISTMSPNGSFSWGVRTLCRRRGRFTLGPITLASGDPFDLFRIERELTPFSHLVVYPATVSLPGFQLPMSHLPGGEQMQRRTHYTTTNVSGVRDYVPGDTFNRIHWPSSARNRRLIAKEFELDPTADVWIVLDLEGAVHRGEMMAEEELALEISPSLTKHDLTRFQLDPSTEEYCVTIAASIARHFLLQNKAVGLIAQGEYRHALQLDRGERQINKILETLAIARADGRIPLQHVIMGELRNFARNTTLVVVTPNPSDTWVGSLRDVHRRGVQTVAVLVEASTFGPGDPVLAAVTSLAANDIPSHLVKNGDDISVALTQRTMAYAQHY